MSLYSPYIRDQSCQLSIFQTGLLNKHLSELMEGLSAKVFRTYNASKTLQEQLEELTIGEREGGRDGGREGGSREGESRKGGGGRE